MSQPPKRNSSRIKKPNRFLQLDDSEIVNYSTSQVGQQPREIRSGTLEATQIAKLFTKFVVSINKKFKEYMQNKSNDNPSQQHLTLAEINKNDRRIEDGAISLSDAALSKLNKRGTDSRLTNLEESARLSQKRTEKKYVESRKHNLIHSSGLNSDMTTLGANLQKEKNFDSHKILQSQIKEKIQQKMGLKQINRQKVERQRNKKQKHIDNRLQSQDLKPFKRQSYHVAIAYHIHLKNIKSSQNLQAIDPTYNARKLRQQQQKQ